LRRSLPFAKKRATAPLLTPEELDFATESFPSSEEGRPRRSNIGTPPQEIGAAGEVRRFLQAWSDLPGCALI